MQVLSNYAGDPVFKGPLTMMVDESSASSSRTVRSRYPGSWQGHCDGHRPYSSEKEQHKQPSAFQDPIMEKQTLIMET